MSELKFDSDGFEIVRIKKGLKNKSTKVPPKNIHFEKQENKIDVVKSYRRIETCVEDLEISEYWKNANKAVRKWHQ
ncbi:uncharacterized protein LOC126772238 isoform X2 [Nymphalis io]|uniref:uncharacterized protein LOC126772238 isoform X2 n=1 Tax=Inachis io TaxID=171585 RepID=UPI002168F601|nr:uncharacterized protein LOC126772238 isoform X2 [Nymphalis io]